MCEFNLWEQLSHKLISVRVGLDHTEESQPVAEQHCWTQVVNQVQIREGPSDTVIL